MRMVELLATNDASPFFILMMIVVMVSAITYSIVRSNQHKATLQSLAMKIGGTFVEGGAFSQNHLEFKFGSRSARLDFYGGSKNSSPFTKVVVQVGGRSPGMLHILEEGFGQSFLKMFGAQDLEVGDPLFDSQYVLKATPATLVRQLFSGRGQRDGIRIVRRLSGFIRPTFDLDAQTVTVQVRQYLRGESELLNLIESAREFTAFVLDPVAPAGIVLEEVKILSGGACPVCGTAMTSQTVRCQTCRTPHHSECWQYLGRCSTYACGETRSR